MKVYKAQASLIVIAMSLFWYLLTIDTNNRGRLIEKWLELNKNSYSTFVIFDDKPRNQFTNLENYFVQTKKEIGLTINNIVHAREILDE